MLQRLSVLTRNYAGRPNSKRQRLRSVTQTASTSILMACWYSRFRARGSMATKQKDTVNLDALIPRDDVETVKPKAGKGVIQVTELTLGKHFYGLLRKPLFQRETNDWGVDNVVSLVRSFRSGHLIPSVILWSADGSTFGDPWRAPPECIRCLGE